MRELAITAVGADRPGIVAALSEALLELGGNLEDCRAALLRGSFAVVLVVAVDDAVSREDVRAVIATVAERLGLGLWVGAAEPPAPAATEGGERCVLSVYGADHPGIVAGFARALADLAVNVVDLSSRLVGDPPIYVLGIEADLPAGLSAPALEAALRPVAETHRVEMSIAVESQEVM